MNKSFKFLLPALIASLTPSLVAAGNKYSKPVYITTGRFEGALGSARNTSNTVEYIGCNVSNGIGYCYARDAAGTSQSCSTTNETHLQNIRAIGSTSFVQVYHSDGTCSTVYVGTMSYYEVPVN